MPDTMRFPLFLSGSSLSFSFLFLFFSFSSLVPSPSTFRSRLPAHAVIQSSIPLLASTGSRPVAEQKHPPRPQQRSFILSNPSNLNVQKKYGEKNDKNPWRYNPVTLGTRSTNLVYSSSANAQQNSRVLTKKQQQQKQTQEINWPGWPSLLVSL